MTALEPQQRAWVLAYLETGCRSATEAARLAGYAPGGAPQSVRMAGHRLKNDEKVLAAIKELAEKRVKSGAYLAMSVLREIAEDPTHKDRFKAAVEMLNRAGMIVVQKQEVEHKHLMDAREVAAGIRQFAKELGLDETKLLGAAGYTDVDFEVVSPISDTPQLTAPEEPVMSSAGLEDLL